MKWNIAQEINELLQRKLNGGDNKDLIMYGVGDVTEYEELLSMIRDEKRETEI